ncbi:peroxiredoxin [Sphingomonas oleivorans]|uniref:Peroxiredoxin n=1 Tax=Sphingomonas oleivorans TaxID=1735121 RepID=A0A2T5G1H4_9SPHN|nr:DsrE family protein [Sphingomonas oleivorans]PTQ12988.1 peroxiredoxin [Sphingomonas oleivorans]
MRGLTIIVAEPAPERFRAALSLAAAQAALGASARIFCQGMAVTLLRSDLVVPGDAAQEAAGLPRLGQLLDEALALGVELIACQSGLHLTGMDAARLDPRMRTGGFIGLLQDLGEDRLLFA